MNLQELYGIRIGGSCGGRFSRPVIGITTYENRLLQNNEHSYFWEDSKFCINNGIYLIVNIDSYITGGRWKPTNQQLRDFVIDTKNKLKVLGANKTNCRFTTDNESDEYEGFSSYMNWVRVIHDALAGEFDLGAGNFRTTEKSWYEWLAQLYSTNCYEVIDVHYQDGLVDNNTITLFSNWLLSLKNKYQIKRMAVTEGNNFYNVSSLAGHNLLKFQILEAERIGCEDFCFVYANWMHNGIESDEDMSYNWNFNPISNYWKDMLNFIKLKKPKEEINVKYKRPQQLQLFYDEVGWVRPYNENLPNLPIVGRKEPNKNITWADLDAVMESLIKAIFKDKNYPNIKYNADGSWNKDWQIYAKSGGVDNENK